jgi:sigma-B regulation protein RsbU (phosphoserine phosphatase)
MNPNQLKKLESENRRLKRAIEELSILNEIATAINSSMVLEKIVDLIIQKCIKHLKVKQAAVMLLEKDQAENPFRTMIRRADTTRIMLPYKLDTQLTGFMLKNHKPIMINNFANDDRFQYTGQNEFPIQSLLTVPLFIKGELIGLLVTFNKKDPEGFTQDDQRMLSIIATQSAQVIENARLLDEEQELMQIQNEMKMAYDIQMNLLPKVSPQLVGYDIAGISVPAQIVGGDYFDFIMIEDNRLSLCLGDVSGKGIAAAMLMANLQATIRSQTRVNPEPKDCLQHSNKHLFQSTDRQKFATLFYGILDIQTHQLVYANAGHNRPYFFSGNDQPVCLETAGLALSIMYNVFYAEDTISFKPGDFLLIYSDGITEAMNAENEEFGEERLIALMIKNRNQSANQLIKNVIASVQQFTGGKPQTDDMTLIVIRRT